MHIFYEKKRAVFFLFGVLFFTFNVSVADNLNGESLGTNSTLLAAEKLCVIRGNLLTSQDKIEQQVSKNKFNYISVDYSVVEINKGDLDTNIVNVSFVKPSLKGVIPENAIVIFLRDKKYGANRVIGDEAWRGIFPDTPENWERITSMSSEALSKTPQGQELPKAKAIELAEQEVIDHGVFSEDNRVQKVRRIPFGWWVDIVVVAPQKNGYLDASEVSVQVSDNGEVINYQPERCGWMHLDIAPNESVEEKLNADYGLPDLGYESQ